MKNIILILFCFTSIYANATTYYCAPTGTDGAYPTRGTFANPWKTWNYAFNHTTGHDTVYFRGGAYDNSAGAGGEVVGVSGSAGNYICFFNYPGEVPILDCSNKTVGESEFQRAMTVWYVSYLHFKGLQVTNLPELPIDGGYANTSGINVYLSDHVIFENMVISNIGGEGFTSGGCDEMYVINCDSYNHCDYNSFWPGQNGTGFGANNRVDNFDETMYDCHIYFEGCRTWEFSDNGFGIQGVAYVEIKNCWAFNGGLLNGEGCGYKYSIGTSNNTTNPLSRKIFNCVAAYNGNYGFSPNNNGGSAFNGHYYNNISYHNGYKHDLLNWNASFGIGFTIFNHIGTPTDEMYANNIAYDNEYEEVYEGGTYTHEYNNWDIPLYLTDADFISVDSTGITDARQADGSLPDNDCYKYFLRPSSTFQGYKQGTDVLETYDAVDSIWRSPPSIGFKEYYPTTPPVDPSLADVSTYHPYWLTSTTASTGGIVSDDGGGTVSARGVCWNTTGTPTTTDSKTSNGVGDGAFTSIMTGLTQGTTYYIRAYATNEAGTAYGSQMTFRTQIIKHLNKVIKHLGKFIIVN